MKKISALKLLINQVINQVISQVINKSRLLISLKLLMSLIATLLIASCDSNNGTSLSAKSIIYCSEGSPASFNPQTITSGTSIDATSNQLYDRLISF